jgi:hypothetical protein
MDSPASQLACIGPDRGPWRSDSGSQEASGAHASAIAPNNATASSTARVAVDLAKDVFELAFADASGRIVERKRLSRAALVRAHDRSPVRRVVTAYG